MEITRNDNYYGGKPYLDGIKYLFIPDPTVAAMALQNGDADIDARVDSLTASTLKTRGFTVIAPGDQWAVWLTPDSQNSNSPLSSLKVRQALEYATDKASIAEGTGYGYLNAITQLADPGYPAAWIPNLQGRDYDPAKAKQLLALAGYPNGLTIMLEYPTGLSMDNQMVALRAQWAAVGVILITNAVPSATFFQDQTVGWHNGLMLVQTGINPAWTETFDQIFTVAGTTYVSTTRPDGYAQLMSDANKATDFATYQTRTQKVTQLLFDQATAIPLFGQCLPYVTAPYVQDTGFLGKNSITLWSPSKTWLNK